MARARLSDLVPAPVPRGVVTRRVPRTRERRGVAGSLRRLHAVRRSVALRIVRPDLPRSDGRGPPVVGCAAGGMLDIVVDGETGRLVPPQDPAALAGAIVEIAGDPSLQQSMGRAGRLRLLERFTHRSMARGFEELYRKVIDSSPGNEERHRD
ncbi:MAG: glycosyltransferase [Thermoanaerobaculia bacterium]